MSYARLILLCVLMSITALARAEQAASFADIAEPETDSAQIIFLKPVKGVVSALPVAVLELEGESRRLLGVMNKNSRLVLNVAPGTHRFMSHMGATAHFMDAKVEAGKRYFVLVRFIYGNGFQLRPIRPGVNSDYDSGGSEFAR